MRPFGKKLRMIYSAELDDGIKRSIPKVRNRKKTKKKPKKI